MWGDSYLDAEVAIQRCFLLFTILLITASGAPTGLFAQQVNLTISGTVRDAGSGDPIHTASIVHNGVVVAMTNDAGVYEVPKLPVDGAGFTLVYRRIGYGANVKEVALPDTGSAVSVDVMLLPAPTDLERIVVSGERIAVANPGLVGFYERRERGFGRYLTGDEIERIGGVDLVNHLRRLRVRAQPADLRDPFSRPTFSDCYAAYIDGVRLIDLTTINEWISATTLGGIEVHRPNEISNLPKEFVAPPPPGCMTTAGVVMFWSRVLREPSPFEFGVHLGGLYGGENEASGQYLGASFITRVRSGESTLRILLDLNARVGGETSRWQALLNLVVRPFGYGSPLYTGLGAGLSKRGSVEVGDLRESLAGHHTILAGLDFAAAFVRPFVQVYVLDPLAPSRVALSSSLGVKIQLGS